jgi:hypothetical protein
LADEAAALLRGYFEGPALAARYKPDHTLLTEADRLPTA